MTKKVELLKTNNISDIISKFETKTNDLKCFSAKSNLRQFIAERRNTLPEMNINKKSQDNINEVFYNSLSNIPDGIRLIYTNESTVPTIPIGKCDAKQSNRKSTRLGQIIDLISWLPMSLLTITGMGLTCLIAVFLLPRGLSQYILYPGFRLLFGTLYPAYASYKAVRTKNVKEYVKWMMYWIVFAFFSCIETFTDIFFSWFPFYYEVKVIIVLWLLSPATKGSSTLYRKFVHPMLTRREQEIDEYITQAKEKGYTAVLQLGSRGVNYATNVIMQTALKGGGNLVSTLRKSYSLSDLSEPDMHRAQDEVDDIVRTQRVLRPRTHSTRSSSSGRNVEMYFPEVDVPRHKEGTPDYNYIRSTEDISSGYSSAEPISALSRTASLTNASKTRIKAKKSEELDSLENEPISIDPLFLNSPIPCQKYPLQEDVLNIRNNDSKLNNDSIDILTGNAMKVWYDDIGIEPTDAIYSSWRSAPQRMIRNCDIKTIMKDDIVYGADAVDYGNEKHVGNDKTCYTGISNFESKLTDDEYNNLMSNTMRIIYDDIGIEPTDAVYSMTRSAPKRRIRNYDIENIMEDDIVYGPDAIAYRNGKQVENDKSCNTGISNTESKLTDNDYNNLMRIMYDDIGIDPNDAVYSFRRRKPVRKANSAEKIQQKLTIIEETVNASNFLDAISSDEEFMDTIDNNINDIEDVDTKPISPSDEIIALIPEPEGTTNIRELQNPIHTRDILVDSEHIYESMVTQSLPLFVDTNFLKADAIDLQNSLSLSRGNSSSDLTVGCVKRNVSHNKGKAPVPPTELLRSESSEQITAQSTEANKKKKTLMNFIPFLSKPISPSTSSKNISKETDI